MAMKTMTMLCIILIVSACNWGKAAETAYDIVDLGQPLVEQGPSIIQTSVAPTPTFGVANPIKDYFVLASSPDCEFIDDDDNNTFRSVRCQQDGNIVKFDEYLIESASDDVYDFLLTSPDIQVTSEPDSSWWDLANPDVKLGKFLEYKDKNGGAGIFWNVFGERISGWAYNTDGDQEALLQWWKETASRHK